MGTGVRSSLVESNSGDKTIQVDPELHAEFNGVRIVNAGFAGVAELFQTLQGQAVPPP